LWRFDAKSAGRENPGVSYWPREGKEGARVLMGTGDGRLIALDAKTGVLVRGYGDGVVDLRAGMTDRIRAAFRGRSTFGRGSFGGASF